MGKITIYLDKQQEEFVKALCNITGANRYGVIKLTFQVGVICIGLLADIKKDILNILQKVDVKADKGK